ncbi:hypothetical protein [Solicola gregarius]|uniref:Uncharacterized protein n=1 Tax=Solicola gregarius TaxID=2908642 RepID=A0AA46TGH9_9ACTN|nr:hypothetical protein [Solicola gregarius]UYM04929.1 hypothetical protein L0C25_20775 [Solicola gregarius]
MPQPTRDQLGALLRVHRPMRPLYAWAFLVAISCPFAILAAIGPPGPVVGVIIFLLFFVPFTYAFGEWLLLQHRIHEHALVLRSIPGLRTYVVPFHTVDADDIAVRPRHRVPRGEFHVAQRHQRECPLVEQSLHVTGLHPDEARRLAKGRLGRHDIDAGYETARWRLSFRDAHRNGRLLADAVRASRGAQRR